MPRNPRNNHLKAAIRERRKATGENYTTARRAVLAEQRAAGSPDETVYWADVINPYTNAGYGLKVTAPSAQEALRLAAEQVSRPVVVNAIRRHDGEQGPWLWSRQEDGPINEIIRKEWAYAGESGETKIGSFIEYAREHIQDIDAALHCARNLLTWDEDRNEDPRERVFEVYTLTDRQALVADLVELGEQMPEYDARIRGILGDEHPGYRPPGTKVVGEEQMTLIVDGVQITETVTRWNDTDRISVDYVAIGGDGEAVELWEDPESCASWDDRLSDDALIDLLDEYDVTSP